VRLRRSIHFVRKLGAIDAIALAARFLILVRARRPRAFAPEIDC
jgi:hypothetical protein